MALRPLIKVLLFTMLFSAAKVFGQNTSDIASKEICECIEKKIQNTEQQHLRDSVYRCFGNTVAIHHDKLKKEFKIKTKGTTIESIMQIRDRLFIKLHKECKVIDVTSI